MTDALVPFLLALVVVMALGSSGLAIWGSWLIWGRATQAARYDLDAAKQAEWLQGRIDAQVASRVASVSYVVDAEGTVRPVSRKGRSDYPIQPPAGNANVRQTGQVDDVHEDERDLARLIGDADFEARDSIDHSGATLADRQPRKPTEPIEP